MTGELILSSYTLDTGRVAINNAFSGQANFNIVSANTLNLSNLYVTSLSADTLSSLSQLNVNDPNSSYVFNVLGSNSNLICSPSTTAPFLTLSAGSNTLSSIGVGSFKYVSFFDQTYCSISMGVRGIDDSVGIGYGQPRDTYIYSSLDAYGLNIINAPSGTDDYIRFYAGADFDDGNGIPNIHIQGNGATQGFVGLNTINPTERLHVSGNTIITGSLNVKTIGAGSPIINLGLDSSGNIVTGTTGSVGTFQTLTDAATIIWDYSLGSNSEVTLTANRILSISNVTDGQYGTILVKQDGVGSHNLTLGGAGTHKVVNGGGGSILLTSNASAEDILSFVYRASTTTFYWNVGYNYN